MSLVVVYGLIRFKTRNKLQLFIIGTLMIIVSFIFYFVFINQLSTSENLLIIVVFNTLICFSLLRFQNKVTHLFLSLFLSSIILLFFIGLQFNDSIIFVSLLIAVVFFLAENNQIFMRKSYEDAAAEYQNKILDKQVEEVQNIYMTMRSWRHDYHNHLQKLKAHIMMNQVEEANQYLNDLEIDLDKVNQLVESGNVNLDAILNSKLSLAKKNNININYKAQVPKHLTVSDIDLCVLIGNLIDNAVEACQKITDDSPKFIRLYIRILKKQLYISVSNSTNEVIRKFDDEYITTKRGNHGHGLKRINNIVEKYDGYINRQNEPKVFVSEVLLPL